MVLILLIFVLLPLLVVALMGARVERIAAGWGAGAALAAWAGETFIEKSLADFGFHLSGGARAFLLFGLVEELLKYFAIRVSVDDRLGGLGLIRAALVCAAGFASVENCIYVVGFAKSLAGDKLLAAVVARLLLPFAFHLANAPVLVCGKLIPSFKPAAGIFLAVLLHGSYDLFLSVNSAHGWSFVVLAACFILSAWIFKDVRLQGGRLHER